MKRILHDSAHRLELNVRESGTLASIGLLSGVVLCTLGTMATSEELQVLLIALGSQLVIAIGFVRFWPAMEASERDLERTDLFRNNSGHVVVEVGLSFPLVFVVMMGTFTFGQALFAYNMLQSSMRSAARYASLAPYDRPDGSNWKQQVKNIALFGDPTPGQGAVPLAPGLGLEHVTVSALIVNGEPDRVTVAVQNLAIHNLFGDITVSRPVVVFPFLGRVLVPSKGGLPWRA